MGAFDFKALIFMAFRFFVIMVVGSQLLGAAFDWAPFGMLSALVVSVLMALLETLAKQHHEKHLPHDGGDA